MELLQTTVANHTHHARCWVSSDPDGTFQELIASVQEEFSFNRAHPDLLVIQIQSLSIENARSIRDWGGKRAVSGTKVCILSVQSITREAQNALLKLFEEPGQETYFHLIAPTESFILPTLRSRMSVTTLVHPVEEREEEARTFLSAGLAARLEQLAPLIKEKDLERTRQFLAALEGVLWRVGGDSDQRIRIARASKDLVRKRSYLEDRSASIKSILETVAIVVPTFKT